MKTLISVDPGSSGAICVHDGTEVHAHPMPETRGDCIKLLVCIALKAGLNPIVAYHEKINGFIPDGGPSMMFQFGASCERVSCILETLGIRIIEVTPQAWIKSLGLGSKGLMAVPKPPKGAKKEEKARFNEQNAEAIKSAKDYNARQKKEWKLKLKDTAQKLFPKAHVTLKTADALLILEYAMRQEGGGQQIVAGSKPNREPAAGDSPELPFSSTCQTQK